MESMKTTPAERGGVTMQGRKVITEADRLKQLFEKQNNKEVIWVKVDDRTYIELPANLSKEDQAVRIENYIKNAKHKLKKN